MTEERKQKIEDALHGIDTLREIIEETCEDLTSRESDCSASVLAWLINASMASFAMDHGGLEYSMMLSPDEAEELAKQFQVELAPETESTRKTWIKK